MKIGYYQFTVEIGQQEKNLEKIAQALEDTNFDLLVLPELFASGALFHTPQERLAAATTLEDSMVVAKMLSWAQTHGGYLVGTILELEGAQLYNTAVIAGPKGLVGTQRKRFPSLTEGYYTPGKRSKTFNINNISVGIAICADAEHDAVYEDLQNLGAQLICHPANFIGESMQREVANRVRAYPITTITANRLGNDLPMAPFAVDFVGESRILLANGTALEQAQDEERLAIIDWNP